MMHMQRRQRPRLRRGELAQPVQQHHRIHTATQPDQNMAAGGQIGQLRVHAGRPVVA